MNISQLKYRKVQVYRFLLTVSLVLSLFSLSGPVGISSVQLQKSTTEFLWTGKGSVASDRIWCANVEASVPCSGDCGFLGIIEQEALLAYNQVTYVQLHHVANQFKSIKPQIVIACGFARSLTYDEPSIV